MVLLYSVKTGKRPLNVQNGLHDVDICTSAKNPKNLSDVQCLAKQRPVATY
jgi:hypothetical protein